MPIPRRSSGLPVDGGTPLGPGQVEKTTQLTVTATGLVPITGYDVYLDTTPGTPQGSHALCISDSNGALTRTSCQFAVPSITAYSQNVNLLVFLPTGRGRRTPRNGT